VNLNLKIALRFRVKKNEYQEQGKLQKENAVAVAAERESKT
jgi:hypothetical protein